MISYEQRMFNVGSIQFHSACPVHCVVADILLHPYIGQQISCKKGQALVQSLRHKEGTLVFLLLVLGYAFTVSTAF